MSGSVWWGVLAITLFALLGFGLLSSGALIQRLPPKVRPIVVAAGQAFYLLFLAWGAHRALFAPQGPVANGLLSETGGAIVWAALIVLGAVLTVRNVIKTLALTRDETDRGSHA